MDSGVPNSPSPLSHSHRALTAMDNPSRRSYADSDNSPDHAKPWRPHPQYLFPKSLRKVQVVYYLARISGRLEHPHYIELTLPLNQPLRLKDVLDRLVALRGSGMPSQYSWSCKRSYKRGYVWYDLAPNDIIHPSSEGAEYVLKGSELLQHTSERCQVEEVHVSKRHSFHQVETPNRSSLKGEFQEEEYEEAEKRSFASSTEPNGLAVARSRRWVLLQLIACGNSAMSKANKREIGTVESEKEVVKKVSTTTEITEEETVKSMSEKEAPLNNSA